jgi:3-polyprenyl-4-hydroxybenzoate decarboxylase
MDFERFRLRRFLDSLGHEELQKIETPVALADVAAALEGNPRAVWFSRAGPEAASLAGNVAGSRSRLAHAFGTTPQRLLQEVLSRLRTKP